MSELFIRSLLIIVALLFSQAAIADSEYDVETLRVKQAFMEGALQALSEPFVGVTEDGSVEQGLFPLRGTGVSTGPLIAAASQFLASLNPQQKLRTQFSVESSEWRHWSNVDNGIFVRRGVSLKEMSALQREAAMSLMRASLSAKGLQLSLDIMKTDQTLREINEDELSFDEELYFFTVMGLPSAKEPWGWQLDGHHLVINYFVLGDQVVMTPVFLGGEPVIAKTGKYTGNQVLQMEQNLGLKLMQTLNGEQRKLATLASLKIKNNARAQANQDNLRLPFQGVPVTEFTQEQKEQLLQLVELFVGNLRDDHAAVRMEEVKARLDETRFAWVGGTTKGGVFYYRIHSPVILIEFDHQLPVGTSKLNSEQKPSRDHIHVIVRTPNGNDYGKDLLRQHLAEHAH